MGNVPEKKRKQSEHEKEILQLCDDIIAEMKVKEPETVIPLNIDADDDPIYDKILKTPGLNRIDNFPIYDEINIVEKKDTLVKDTTETIDTYISVKEVNIVTEMIEKDYISPSHRNSSQNHYDTPRKHLGRESSKEYFENLVNILEEAVRDISR